MFTKQIKLCYFFVSLSFALVSVNSQRSQIDSSFRGNSFGLENFLFQSFDDTEVNNAILNTQKVRPLEIYKSDINGQKNFYEVQTPNSITDRPKISTAVKFQSQSRPEGTLNVPQKVEILQQFPVQTKNGERIRTRVVMKRRRKPVNTLPTNGSSDVQANRIFSKSQKNSDAQKVSQSTILESIPSRNSDSMMAGYHSEPIRPTIMASLQPEVIHGKRAHQSEYATMVTTEKTSTINLKTFLKQQTETLSLSELLQTQNLSLADLLKGNKDASVILKRKQPVLPNPINFESVIVRHSEKEVYEPIYRDHEQLPKTVSSDYPRFRPNRIQPAILGALNKNQVISKADNNFSRSKEIVEESMVTTTRRTSLYSPRPNNSDLRTKIRNYQRKTTTTTSTPETSSKIQKEKTENVPSSTSVVILNKVTAAPLYKKRRIPFKSSNNPELAVVMPKKPLNATERRPERLGNNINRFSNLKKIGNEKVKPNENLVIETLKNSNFNELIGNQEEDPSKVAYSASTTESYVEPSTAQDDEQKYDTRDELIELLRSEHNANALKKILQSRNMTLQEVLENREKSTVQSNIEELFSNHDKQKIYSTQTTIIFGSIPDFQVPSSNNFKPHNVAGSEELYADESSPTIGKVKIREPKRYTVPISSVSQESILNFKPDDLTADTSNTENLALWKLSEKSIIYGSTFDREIPLSTKHNTETPKSYRGTTFPEDDIILLETIERNQDTNRKLKVGLNGMKEQEPINQSIEKSYIPPAVKSAIIASGVVMGIALFIFIAIFAACGWRQRQIRLKASSSILNESLNKNANSKHRNTLNKVNINDTKSFKKTLDFEDGASESGTSFAGSYLWSTLKNTFTSRASTLKSRLEKEEKFKEDNENYRSEERERFREDERSAMKKIERGRNVINTSFSFNRSSTKDNTDYFSECTPRF